MELCGGGGVVLSDGWHFTHFEAIAESMGLTICTQRQYLI
jgi:hypothetical protein